MIRAFFQKWVAVGWRNPSNRMSLLKIFRSLKPLFNFSWKVNLLVQGGASDLMPIAARVGRMARKPLTIRLKQRSGS
jgi:hypothetical protein